MFDALPDHAAGSSHAYTKNGFYAADARYPINIYHEAGLLDTPYGAFALAVFMLARYAAIVLWDYNQGGMADTFWSPKIFAWTVWPVGFFLHGSTIWKRPAVTLPESRQDSAGKRVAFTVALVAVGTLAWTAYEGYHPAGVQKQGRMLIDEYHSDWEWTEMPFDTV